MWAGDNTQYKFDVSRVTEVTIALYIRNPNSPPNTGRSDDIFIGTFRINPRFEEVQTYVEDPKLSKKDKEKVAVARAEERLLGQAGTEWLEIQHGTGSMKVGVRFVENRQRSLKIDDFDLLKVVGKGSFGKVMQVL
jgi:serum/glucocorticoid-regulated kinase 2